MLSDPDTESVKRDLLNQVYLRPRTCRRMDHITRRGEQLIALAAELEEAVSDEKPPATTP